jgi:hypothetical protein
MSTAGIYSSQGDSFQDVVALDWAISLLAQPQLYKWIELESCTTDVDDVVISRADGSTVHCQCKKNQPKHNTWKVSDLDKEIRKAASCIAADPMATVKFVARTPFGELASLREYAITQPTQQVFELNMPTAVQATWSQLVGCLPKALSGYVFLQRIVFEPVSSRGEQERHIQDRLKTVVTNANVAYVALETLIRKLTARQAAPDGQLVKHRLTHEDLISALKQVGAIVAPQANEVEVRAELHALSKRGRHWKRDIGGVTLQREATQQIAEFAQQETGGSLLLIGNAGAGKSCVLLDVVEQLEIREDRPLTVFVQCREYAEVDRYDELSSAGFPMNFVEKIARFADSLPVVVVFDSLDVLSTARSTRALDIFLTFIDRLCSVKQVTILSHVEVNEALITLGVEPTSLDVRLKELIRNPRELDLFASLHKAGVSPGYPTSTALARQFIDELVVKSKGLGDPALKACEAMADELMRKRVLYLPRERFDQEDAVVKPCSLNVLIDEKGRLAFGHQTLLDVLVIGRALRLGNTLSQFLVDLPQVPFVRPVIRCFLDTLIDNRVECRKQLRTLFASQCAFHIKRLSAQWLAGLEPEDGDWALFNYLRNNEPALFTLVLSIATKYGWYGFWRRNLKPALLAINGIEGYYRYVVLIDRWKDDDPRNVFAEWHDALQSGLLDGRGIVEQLTHLLVRVRDEHLLIARALLLNLLERSSDSRGELGALVRRCVDVSIVDDEGLWRYATGKVNESHLTTHALAEQLRCASHNYSCPPAENFFHFRMRHSTQLLTIAVRAVERWSETTETENRWSSFLLLTSYWQDPTTADQREDVVLFTAIEAAVQAHAKENSAWWGANRDSLCFSDESALQYIGIQACIASPETNAELIGKLLETLDLERSRFTNQLQKLVRLAFIYLGEQTQLSIEQRIARITYDSVRIGYQMCIPTHLRSASTDQAVRALPSLDVTLADDTDDDPEKYLIKSPLTVAQISNLSDESLVRLLKHYAGYKYLSDGFHSGGESELAGELADAAHKAPYRYLKVLRECALMMPIAFKRCIVRGLTQHLRSLDTLLSNGGDVSRESLESFSADLLSLLRADPTLQEPSWELADAIRVCAHYVNSEFGKQTVMALAKSLIDAPERLIVEGDLVNKGINSWHGKTGLSLVCIHKYAIERGTGVEVDLTRMTEQIIKLRENHVNALILEHLPFNLHQDHQLGWRYFDLILDTTEELWPHAEKWLYHQYRIDFERVAVYIDQVAQSPKGEHRVVWGRLQALATLSNKLDAQPLVTSLKTRDCIHAWAGMVSVFSHPSNYRSHVDTCDLGLREALQSHACAQVLQPCWRLFSGERPIKLPIDFVRTVCDCAILPPDMREWLVAVAVIDLTYAFDAAQIWVAAVKRLQSASDYDYDQENLPGRLLTLFFSEAEEIEEADGGKMLTDVIHMQGELLQLFPVLVNQWLDDAERP